MARFVEVAANVFLNVDSIVSIDAEGASSLVTLVTGKTRKFNIDAQQLAKKCSD